MISSVRLDGTTACMTIEGATNTEVFHAYVREILMPSLRVGDIQRYSLTKMLAVAALPPSQQKRAFARMAL